MNWANERSGSATCTECRRPHSLRPRTASRYLDVLSLSVITRYKNFLNLAAVVRHKKNADSMIVQLRCMARTMINDSKEDTTNGQNIVVRK